MTVAPSIRRRWLTGSVALGWIALSCVSGCSSGAEIWVDVHTDLVPGEEVDRIVIRHEGGATRSARIEPGPVFLESARRVGPLAASPGRHQVTVDLEHGGETVLTRTFSGSFEGTVVLPAWLTRACVGVVCPTPDDPLATECEDGRCVRLDCASLPGGCAGTCVLDSDCPAPPASCVSRLCAAGHCVTMGFDIRCGSGEYCDPDVGCVPRTVPTDAGPAPIDGGEPDAPAELDAGAPDTPPPPPPYRLLRLADGESAWTEISTSGDAPTEAVLAAFASGSEIIAFTRTELFALRTADYAWVFRQPLATQFGAVDPSILFETETIVGLAPEQLYVYVAGGVHLYDWNAAARTASYVTYVARADFPAAEWGTPLAAPYHEVVGAYVRPDDPLGWITPSSGDECGPPPVTFHETYVSWDGFGPAAMLVSTYDFRCQRFVDRELFSSFPPFARPGTPSDPWSIEAATWAGALYLFVSP